MPKRTVGIEIGTENIKIVYGVKKKGDFSLLDYRIIKSSDKVFGLDEELNINEIYPILVSSLEDMNVKKADCYITISSKKTIIRTRDLPIVKKKEMGNIIKFEAEQFLPYSIEAFAVDYKVVGSYVDDEGASFAKVMIVAVPLEIVQDYMALVNLTKLNLRGMTVYTDALFSYFTNNRNNKDRNILIADIGHNFSRMLMIENNE